MKPYQQVFKSLTEYLKPLGFERRRSSWWEIRRSLIWHRVHIHKFTHGDNFRVHAAIHVVGLEDDAPWLNGPMSYDGWFEETRFGIRTRRYEFRFQESPESIEKCATQLRDYIGQCVLPWFEKWTQEKNLIEAPDSPLRPDAKTYLVQAMNRLQR